MSECLDTNYSMACRSLQESGSTKLQDDKGRCGRGGALPFGGRCRWVDKYRVPRSPEGLNRSKQAKV